MVVCQIWLCGALGLVLLVFRCRFVSYRPGPGWPSQVEDAFLPVRQLTP
jgi:hypothetical protein